MEKDGSAPANFATRVIGEGQLDIALVVLVHELCSHPEGGMEIGITVLEKNKWFIDVVIKEVAVDTLSFVCTNGPTIGYAFV